MTNTGTRVGNYTFAKATRGYVLTSITGEIVGTFPTAKAANAKGLALTAAAYKSRA